MIRVLFLFALTSSAFAAGKDGAVCPPYTVGPNCRPVVQTRTTTCSTQPNGDLVCKER